MELPLDAVAWEKKLQRLIAESRNDKKVVNASTADFANSFRK